MNKTTLLLIKFGEEAHIRGLQKGKLYMNPWRYFCECEVHRERRDPNEGVHSWWNPDKRIIKINERTLTSKGGTISASSSCSSDNYNIFCMCGLYKNDSVDLGGNLFDERVMEFGNSFLAISDGKTFIERIKAELSKDKVGIKKVSWNSVGYFDERTYDGEVGPFRKSSRYVHQKEWRLVVEKIKMDDKPFILDIGDISDISIFGRTADFKNRIERYSDGVVNILV